MTLFRMMLLVCVGLIAAVSPGWAQGVTVHGRVADAQGAVIVDATVSLVPPGGRPRIARTRADGTFGFAGVLPGPYTLIVEAMGFSQRRQEIIVGSEAAAIAMTLDVAGFAEDISVTGDTVVRVPEISKTGVPPQEQPRAISVVGRELLDNRVVLEISDALRTVSGAGQVGNYAQFRPTYVLRGFSLSRVFEDGFNVATVGRTAELADTEQIEVLKGPAGALYGNINSGGILNLVSKRADVNTGRSLQLTATSDGLYRPQLDVSGPLTRSGKVRGRSILAYEQGDSYRHAISRETFLVNPSVSWNIAGRTKLDVVARYHHARGTHDQGWPISRTMLDVPPERLLNEVTDTAKYDNGALRTWLTHSINAGWRLRAGFNASIADYDNRFQTFRLPANSDLNVNGVLLNRLPINEQGRSREYIGQFDLTGDFYTGPVRHRLATGVESTWNGSRSTSFADARYPNTIDYQHPVYRYPVPESVVTDFFDDRSGGGAVYLQDQVGVTRWLDVAVGARLDSRDTRRLRENTGVRTERSDTNVAPFAGIVVKPSRTVMLFGNYSESFTTQIGTQLLGGGMPDPNIGWQYEGGIKAETPDRRLSTSLSLFQITQENILVAVPNQTYSIQSGVQRSRGAEIEVNGRPIDRWNVAFAYTALDAFVREDTTLPVGATLMNAADNMMSVWNQFEFGSNRQWNAGLGVFYMGERPANLIAPTATNPGGNTVILPGYTRVDASVGFERQAWRLTLYMENLTDEHYLTARGPVLHPNPPRSARVSLAYRF